MNTMANQKQNMPQPNSEEGSAAKYNHIKNVVAVMSGKGGVGKSFVTGLLASALAREGYQVGILDADITGPSIPMLFGLHGPVEVGSAGIQPLESRLGVKIISMNFLLSSEDQPVVWRGPLISKAIKQLWGDVMWGDLDYLLVDLPPGTSDATLTIMQSLPVKGIVMVTMPQSLATLIVRKAVNMAKSIGVPITGIVENMAYFFLPETGKRYYIFGPSHAEEVAVTADAPILAQLPIDASITTYCDTGKIEEVNLDEIPGFLDVFTKAVPVNTKPKSHNKLIPSTKVNSNMGLDIEQPPRINSQSNATTDEENNFNLKPFSAKARELIESKENMGSLENPNGRGIVRGGCGDTMQIDLMLLGEVIKNAQFMTDGCGATIACGSMLTKLVISRTLSEAQRITPEVLLEALGGIPEGHEHCAELAVKTLHQAILNAERSLIN